MGVEWHVPWLKAVGIAAICLACLGCGDGRPTRVPVSGRVLIDGKPLKQGRVTFVPTDGRASSGKLNDNGEFKLSCFETDDGALVGTHRIAVLAAEGISETKTRWFAPKKYSDHRTSGLTANIDGPRDDLVIDISWDGGKEFLEVLPGLEGDDFRGGRGQSKQK